MGFGCVICTEDFNTSETDEQKVPMCVKQCGHVFHKSCLLTWLTKSSSCPICRVATTSSGTHITKLHFQRLSLDNSSILTLIDETDKLRDEISSKDRQLAKKDEIIAKKDLQIAAQSDVIKDTQAALAKIAKDITSVASKMEPKTPVDNEKVAKKLTSASSSSSSSASSTATSSSSTSTTGSRVRLVSTRSIRGRGADESAEILEAYGRMRSRVLPSISVQHRAAIASRGRSASSGLLRHP